MKRFLLPLFLSLAFTLRIFGADPADLSNLALRIRAEDITGISNGGDIGTVVDSVGGFTFTVSFSSPQWYDGNTGVINNRATIRFNQGGIRVWQANSTTALQSALTGSGFTYVLWLKVSPSVDISGGDLAHLLAKCDGGDATNRTGLAVFDSETWGMYGGDYPDSSTVLNDDVWRMIVVTVDNGTRATKLYTDDADTSAHPSRLAAATGADSSKAFTIGAGADFFKRIPWECAEICVYSRVLTPTEISTVLAVYSSQYYDIGTGAFSAGTISVSSPDSTTIRVANTGASGGVSPYTYDVHRSATFGFTAGPGNRIATGVTSFPYTDSSPLTGLAEYVVVATDNSAATAESNRVITGRWGAQRKILFIGDSITNGDGAGGSKPGDATVDVLNKLRRGVVSSATHQGITGSQSGAWVSGSGNLTTALSAGSSAGCNVASVSLGTNDVGTVDAATYKTNMQSLVNALLTAGYSKVYLQTPPWINVAGLTGWNADSNEKLRQYSDKLAELHNGTTVFFCGRYALDYFSQHPAELSDDLHPGNTGTVSLGRIWAAGIDQADNPGSGSAAVPRALAY